VHVWTTSLRVSADRLERSTSVLSPAELAKMRSFLRPEDGARFALARSFLRNTLSRYVGAPARAIEFHIEAKGKPYLESPPWLRFNLSHTIGVAVVAICREARVGVDVERLDRTIHNMQRISRRNFTEREQAFLRSQGSDEEKSRAFLEAWTRKEAFIKATGEGLTRRLTSFEVAFGAGSCAKLLSIDGSADKAGAWTMLSFRPSGGTVGALAIEADSLREVRWLRGDP